MRAPAFWWRGSPSLAARLLQPFGALYGAATLARMRRHGSAAGVPVVCVGNFVAGGAGKTPTSLALAHLLAEMGEKPFILMRGYGGRLKGPVLVDPAVHGPTETGDEPLLMARHVPTVVSRDRPKGAAFAKAAHASVIVMDDGLQNPSLAKDLRIAVVDGAVGVGNGLSLPAGPLRAPLAGQLQQTDAVILIGAGAAGDAVAAQARAEGKSLLRAGLAVTEALRARLSGLPVLAASGIGRPEKFTATLRGAGADIRGERPYGDHHPYSASDVAALIREAESLDCTVAVTEKDMVKLAPLWPPEERHRLLSVPVALVFEDEAAVVALLRLVLDRRS